MRSALVVAVDGGAATGKSALCAALSSEFGMPYFNAGLVYRGLTLACLALGIDVTDGSACRAVWCGSQIHVRFESGRTRVWITGHDRTDDLRTPAIDEAVPEVSRHAEVRRLVTLFQRRVLVSDAAAGGIIVDGRDATSVVVPDAAVKLLLLASDATVAARAASRPGRLSGLADVVRNRADGVVSNFRRPREDVLVIATDALSPIEVRRVAVAAVRRALARNV